MNDYLTPAAAAARAAAYVALYGNANAAINGLTIAAANYRSRGETILSNMAAEIVAAIKKGN